MSKYANPKTIFWPRSVMIERAMDVVQNSLTDRWRGRECVSEGAGRVKGGIGRRIKGVALRI